MNKLPDNQNKLNALVSSLASDDPKLSGGLEVASKNIETIWKALFNGPLPAVSGENLTNILVGVLVGIIARANLPEEIAYEDEANVFTEALQKIVDDAAELRIQTSTGVRNGHFQQPADGETILGQNLYGSGCNTVDDGGYHGVAINLKDGELLVYIDHTSDGLKIPFKISVARVILIGNPGYTTGAAEGDVVIKSAKRFYSVNNAVNSLLTMMYCDASDILRLGAGAAAASTGVGHIGIPLVTAANLPAAGASMDGLIVIDTTNHRLCFYEGGLRYYVNGTAF